MCCLGYKRTFEALTPWVASNAPQPLDPCPDVRGMASAKKLKLLRFSSKLFTKRGNAECYLEVGTYQGKSTIAALLNNPEVVAVACDDFSLFYHPHQPTNARIFRRNLRDITGQAV